MVIDVPSKKQVVCVWLASPVFNAANLALYSMHTGDLVQPSVYDINRFYTKYKYKYLILRKLPNKKNFDRLFKLLIAIFLEKYCLSEFKGGLHLTSVILQGKPYSDMCALLYCMVLSLLVSR